MPDPVPPAPPAAAAGTIVLGGDLRAARLGFGALRILGRGGLGPPRDRARALGVLRRAVDLGITLVDTADSYGPGASEELIAEALHPYPAGLVIATKAGFIRPGGAWVARGRPAHLREALDGSLRRLRLERIDLYQLHTVDPKVPIEESVGTLAEMQTQGKIRHIGVSNVSVEQLRRAQAVARIVSVQNEYSLAERESDDVVDACAREGLAFLPWAPLAAARRGGKTLAANLATVALKHSATPAQVALAWLLRRSPAVLPIPGTGSPEHLEENVAAAGVRLSDEEYETLTRV
ncbi:MAG TPA: aldo/keto reductase [bacterium]|nr:aldo/keto reductase [bacterium]